MEKTDIQKWWVSLRHLVCRLNIRVEEQVKLKRDPKTNLWYIYKDGIGNAKAKPLCAISFGLEPMKAEELSIYLNGILDGFDTATLQKNDSHEERRKTQKVTGKEK